MADGGAGTAVRCRPSRSGPVRARPAEKGQTGEGSNRIDEGAAGRVPVRGDATLSRAVVQGDQE